MPTATGEIRPLEPALVAPGEEPGRGLGVGRSGVRVADPGREELGHALGGRRPGPADDRRQALDGPVARQGQGRVGRLEPGRQRRRRLPPRSAPTPESNSRPSVNGPSVGARALAYTDQSDRGSEPDQLLIGQPPEVGERLGAIIARAGEVSQQATVEALFKFIDDEHRRG